MALEARPDAARAAPGDPAARARRWSRPTRLAPELRDTFDALDPVDRRRRAAACPALNRILIAARPALKVLYVAGRELIPVADYLRLYRTDIDQRASPRSPSAVNFPVNTVRRHQQRILRSLFVINDETPSNASQRLGANRHNAYPLPGALRRVDERRPAGARTAATSTTRRPSRSSASRRRRARSRRQFDFRGELRSYPHVELAPVPSSK